MLYHRSKSTPKGQGRFPSAATSTLLELAPRLFHPALLPLTLPLGCPPGSPAISHLAALSGTFARLCNCSSSLAPWCTLLPQPRRLFLPSLQRASPAHLYPEGLTVGPSGLPGLPAPPSPPEAQLLGGLRGLAPAPSARRAARRSPAALPPPSRASTR